MSVIQHTGSKNSLISIKAVKWVPFLEVTSDRSSIGSLQIPLKKRLSHFLSKKRLNTYKDASRIINIQSGQSFNSNELVMQSSVKTTFYSCMNEFFSLKFPVKGLLKESFVPVGNPLERNIPQMHHHHLLQPLLEACVHLLI